MRYAVLLWSGIIVGYFVVHVHLMRMSICICFDSLLIFFPMIVITVLTMGLINGAAIDVCFVYN